jgi:hypothetical protein
MYKLLTDLTGKPLENFVMRVADNAVIPFDPDNVDYQEYLKWIAAGNTPTPADTPNA